MEDVVKTPAVETPAVVETAKAPEAPAPAPKAPAPKVVPAPEVKKPITLEQKFDAMCKLLQIRFKEDAGRVIAVK